MMGIALVLAAALSAGNAEFDRTANEGAARISIARFLKNFTGTGPAPGSMVKAMSADPAAFRTLDEAKARCHLIYSNACEQTFRVEVEAVRSRLGLDEDFLLEMKAADREALDRFFAGAFALERKEVVDRQAQGLAATTRPSEAEFEEKSEEVLKREMVERIAAEQKETVFEENVAYISDRIVGPILASGREERTRQGEYLKRARSEAAVPSKLAKELAEKLAANVAEKRKGVHPSKAWGVFPSVAETVLPKVVEKRLTDRFVTQIENVTLGVTEESVEEMIARDPASHVKAGESEKLFAAHYSTAIRTQARKAALAEVSEAERAELAEFIDSHGEETAVRKGIDRVVRREVMPKWKTARAEVSRRLSEALWPSLIDGTWFPEAELADSVSARSDYQQAVRKWRELAEMRNLATAGNGRPLLEEALVSADGRVAVAFERARSAIAAQQTIVDQVRTNVLVAARERKYDLKTVMSALTTATMDGWSLQRVPTLWPDGNLPANADDQHVDLFPSVIKKIELVAREILEEASRIEKEESEAETKAEESPAKEKPEEKPEEEEPPEEQPQDEEEPEEDMLFSLSVKRSSAGLEIKLLQGKKVVQSSTVPAKAKDFRAAMKELSEVISSQVLNLK